MCLSMQRQLISCTFVVGSLTLTSKPMLLSWHVAHLDSNSTLMSVFVNLSLRSCRTHFLLHFYLLSLNLSSMFFQNCPAHCCTAASVFFFFFFFFNSADQMLQWRIAAPLREYGELIALDSYNPVEWSYSSSLSVMYKFCSFRKLRIINILHLFTPNFVNLPKKLFYHLSTTSTVRWHVSTCLH